MDVADVPLPGNTPDVRAPATTRCTVHVFTDFSALSVTPEGVGVGSGSTVYIADEDWPPAVLFDAGYAALVLKTFGVKASVDMVKSVWGHRLTFDLDLGTATERERMKQEEEKVRRKKSRPLEAEPDFFDLVLMVPYMGVPPEQLDDMWEAEEKKREEHVQEESEAKVEEWRMRCAASTA